MSIKIKIISIILLLFLHLTASSQELNFSISGEDWRKDFQSLKNQVSKVVPNSINKDLFNSTFNKILETDFNKLSNTELFFEMQRLLNTLKDEGCYIPFFQNGVDLKLLPIKAYWFNDGLYILDAHKDYKEIIGKRITKVNNTSIEDLFGLSKSYINADNIYYKKHLFQAYGFMPALLNKLDIGINDAQIKLSFASGNTVLINSASIQEYVKLSRNLPNDGFFSPLNKNHSENYWFEFMPNTNTLFIQFQEISNNESGDSFSKFVKKVKNIIENEQAQKIIIDLRYGGGGNGFKLNNLVDTLKDSNTINQYGALYILTSKATRGTLLELVSILRLNTKAIIIGEPTAEGPNTVGDVKLITLPNSKIKVFLTHTLWPTSWDIDTNNTIYPDVEITYNFEERGTDPWLEKAMNHKIDKSITEIPNALLKKITGTYNVEDRKVKVVENQGRLFLTLSKRIKSFFEIHTELFYQSEGILNTDISNVTISYDPKTYRLLSLNWKERQLKMD